MSPRARREDRAQDSSDIADIYPMQLMVVGPSRTILDALRIRLLREDDVGEVRVETSTGAACALLRDPMSLFDVVIAECEIAHDLLRALPNAEGLHSRAPIIVLGDSTNVRDALEDLRLGAVGWIHSTSSVAVLMDTIRAVRSRMSALPSRLLRELTSGHSPVSPPSKRDEAMSKLSERERQILGLLEQGLGRREIAAELHLSPNTVRTHIQSILRRLNVHSTLAAVAVVRTADDASTGPTSDGLRHKT